jgi:hypothetical protein
MKLLKILVQFSQPPTISSLCGPNILLSTLFSNTLSVYSPLTVSDYVPHAYKTTGTILVSYISIFTFYRQMSRREKALTEW